MTQYNCPNCGAPISSDICPYCGTAFLDWSCLELHKDNWIKIKIDGKVCLIKANFSYLGVEFGSDPQTLYSDNNPYIIAKNPTLDLHLDLSARPFKVPGHKDSLMIEVDPSVADLRQVSDILKGVKQNE